jgi:hypothetical protein
LAVIDYDEADVRVEVSVWRRARDNSLILLMMILSI